MSGITGLAYLRSRGGMAPGDGGGTPPPGKGGPPDDKGDDETGEEENEEDDTDEETVSVTSSSQVSAGRVGPLKWNGGKENTKEGVGGPPEDPMIPPEEEVLGMDVEDHGDTEARGAGPDHLKGMGQWDLWDLLDQGDAWDWEYPLYLMLT